MKVTLDTTLGTLLDDPQAKAVLDRYLPGISTNPLTQMAKGMSLRMILSMPQAKQFGLTEEKAEEILAEVNKQLWQRPFALVGSCQGSSALSRGSASDCQ